MDNREYVCEVVELTLNTGTWGKKFFGEHLVNDIVGHVVTVMVGWNEHRAFVSPNLLGEPWVLTQWPPTNEQEGHESGLGWPLEHDKPLWLLTLKVVK